MGTTRKSGIGQEKKQKLFRISFWVWIQMVMDWVELENLEEQLNRLKERVKLVDQLKDLRIRKSGKLQVLCLSLLHKVARDSILAFHLLKS